MPAADPQHSATKARRRLEIRAAARFPWQGIGMFGRRQAFSSATLLAAFLAGACAAGEPRAERPLPTATAGAEQLATTSRPRGNVQSARMAVEDRPAAAPVDPDTVSSTPSALIQQEQAPQNADTYVSTPPPAPQPEASPTETSPHWVWAPGYWYWHGGRYVWIAGAWIPARQGHVYVGARWTRGGRGWRFVPGGWAVSAYDPILYPVYPYDPYYYGRRGGYWRHHDHGRAHHRHHRNRLQVRPHRGSHGRPNRAPPSSRIRVRAR